jgi:hypothetical protein
MEKRTVRAVYEDGEVTFAEPVNFDGCWHIEVSFIEQEDPAVPYEVSSHRPELRPVADRLEELHRDMESKRPPPPY